MIKKEVRSVTILYDNKSITRSYGKGVEIEEFKDKIIIASDGKIYFEFSKSIPYIIEYY